ncbi:Fur family transcriptional regulator [Caldiplasma sukawensis]
MIKLDELLKDNNLKITPQRLGVLQYIYDNPGRHFTAEDVHNFIKIDNPGIPPATVYNILRIFTEKNLINSFEVNGRAIFESNLNRHINFVCNICGKIEDVDDPEYIKTMDNVMRNVPGKGETAVTVIRGICRSCLSRNQ